MCTAASELSFNRTQSRVVAGLLTGHNTLRRHLCTVRLSNNPTCRKCGTEEETSVHILCDCEALASRRHTHLGSFFLIIIIIIIIIILIIIIIINCNWVVTRWQWLFYMYTNMKKSN